MDPKSTAPREVAHEFVGRGAFAFLEGFGALGLSPTNNLGDRTGRKGVGCLVEAINIVVKTWILLVHLREGHEGVRVTIPVTADVELRA